MNTKRILVPLDLAHGKTGALVCLQQMALQSPFHATLLYVVELNVASPDSHLYEEVCAEAESTLRKVARRFFGNEEALDVSVRVGRPDEQILAEARSCQAELIIMTSAKPRGWRSLFHSRTVERVMHGAKCPTLVLPLSWNTPGGKSSRPARQTRTYSSSPSLLHPTWFHA